MLQMNVCVSVSFSTTLPNNIFLLLYLDWLIYIQKNREFKNYRTVFFNELQNRVFFNATRMLVSKYRSGLVGFLRVSNEDGRH